MEVTSPEPFKRFLLFCHDTYYPSGGMSDARGSYDTLEEAMEAGGKSHYDGFDILDLEERRAAY